MENGIAPACSAPVSTRWNSGRLVSMMPTVSPRFTPRPASPAAIRLTRSAYSRQVMLTAPSGVRNATASGCTALVAWNASHMVWGWLMDDHRLKVRDLSLADRVDVRQTTFGRERGPAYRLVDIVTISCQAGGHVVPGDHVRRRGPGGDADPQPAGGPQRVHGADGGRAGRRVRPRRGGRRRTGGRPDRRRQGLLRRHGPVWRWPGHRPG